MATLEFESWRDIEKFVESELGFGLNIVDGKPLKTILQEEQARLRRILKEEVANYYRSYSPTTYKRTYEMMKSITTSMVMVENGFLTASIYFDEKAYKPSVIGKTHEEGFTPILINEGWSWRDENLPPDPIEHFHYRNEGFRFGEKTVERYNKENPYGFILTLIKEYNGNPV